MPPWSDHLSVEVTNLACRPLLPGLQWSNHMQGWSDRWLMVAATVRVDRG